MTAVRYFLLLFLPVFVLVSGASIGVLMLHVHHVRVEIGERERTKIEMAQVSIDETLSTAISDLKFLIRDEDMVNYVRSPNEENRKRLERTFIGFSGAKKIFDQVRYIDRDGQEQVRVNFVDGAPRAVDKESLQNKKHRYYFADAVGLPPGRIFMSRLDLNIENKKVEIPYKPMIRLAAPMYVDGERIGVVVLNYLAGKFLHNTRKAFSTDESEGFLLNAEGYWLVGPNRDVEWGFMFDRSGRFQDMYPDAWQQVENEGIQQFLTSRGVFTMSKIVPPDTIVATDNSDPYWLLVSRVSLASWYVDQVLEHVPEIVVTVLVLALFGLGSWRMASSRAEHEVMDSQYRQRLVDALNESEHRNTAVIEASDDVVFTCTEGGFIRHANHAAQTVFNVPQVDLIGREISEFIMDPGSISVRQPDGERKLMERERFEAYAVRGTGEGFPAEITVTPLSTGGYTRFSIFIRDITLRRSYEERLKRLANYDPLTGLSNRVMLLDHLDAVLKDNVAPNGPYAVILGDLDDFRIVNDTLGHVVGDEALKEAAGRIHQKAPPGSIVSRFGGDEFVIVTPCQGDRALPQVICDQLLSAFERPLEVAGHRLYVSISLGIAFADTENDTATGLLQMADVAMYAAKDSGRNTFKVFTHDMHEQAARRLAIQTRLAGAMARGDISLVYQPLVAGDTHRIVGAEALLRWKDEELGPIGPGEFVPIAESTGLIIEFGQWALDQACQHAVQWRETVPDFYVAVNISPVQLIGSDIVSTIKSTLGKNGLPPNGLDVEITEGLLIKDPVEAEETLNELAEVGVHLSIDDFGTGYSSLSYLQRFPFTTLKIDQMFVAGLPDEEDSRSLVEIVLALAQRSRLKVVAEGVETLGQSHWLAEQRCDILQGYYFGKPMRADDFAALIALNAPLPQKPET